MKYVKKRLSLRMWFVMAFIFLFVAPSLILFAVVNFTSSPQGIQKHIETTNQMTQMVLNDVTSWNNPVWQSKLRAMLSNSIMTVRLLDSKHKVIFSYTPKTIGSITIAKNSLSSNYTQNPTSSYLDRYSSWIDQEHSFYAGNKLVGVAEIDTPMVVTGIPNNISTSLSFHDWISGPGGILLWILSFTATFLLIMFVIGRTFVTKMNALSQAVRKINLGYFEIRLPSSVIREVDELSISLSNMKENLNSAISIREEIEQDRRIMIASIIHDLRTPIFTIVGYLEGLQKGIANHPEKMVHYVKICLDKSLLLNHLVSDLFTYSNLDYPKQFLEPKDIEWVDLIRHVLEGFQLMARENNVDLIHDCNMPSILIYGDPQLLTRAVSNLIDNALRHTPMGGKITLSSTFEEYQLQFTLEDTGPGFRHEDLEHLFKPFYRGDKSRNRNTGGAGLGLSITQRIIQTHHGEITATNSVDHGAYFTIKIPVNSSN